MTEEHAAPFVHPVVLLDERKYLAVQDLQEILGPTSFDRLAQRRFDGSYVGCGLRCRFRRVEIRPVS